LRDRVEPNEFDPGVASKQLWPRALNWSPPARGTPFFAFARPHRTQPAAGLAGRLHRTRVLRLRWSTC